MIPSDKCAHKNKKEKQLPALKSRDFNNKNHTCLHLICVKQRYLQTSTQFMDGKWLQEHWEKKFK